VPLQGFSDEVKTSVDTQAGVPNRNVIIENIIAL
jgi:hypothetical protein